MSFLINLCTGLKAKHEKGLLQVNGEIISTSPATVKLSGGQLSVEHKVQPGAFEIGKKISLSKVGTKVKVTIFYSTAGGGKEEHTLTINA